MKIAFLFLLLFPLTARAQPFLDVASLYFQSSPTSKSNSDKNEMTTKLIYLGLTLPVKADSDYIVFSPVYENFRLGFADYFKERNFQVASLATTWLHQWNSIWKTAFIIIPRISGEMKDGITSDQWQAGGAILNTYKRKNTLKYKFGVYCNNEFFGPFVLPLLGIDWNINSSLNLFGVLPGSMNMEYKFSKSIHAGIIFRSITTSYRLTTAHNYIRVYDNHIKLFLDFYLAKKQVITLEAGHTVFRKYRSGIRISGENDYYQMNVSEGFLFKVGYSFRQRTD